MARYLYAATPADYVVSATTGLPVPSAVVTVWTARTGGSQVTDLQNLSLVGVTQVTADSQGYLAFYGPDNMTANLWIYAGSGPRLLVRVVNDLMLSGTALPLSGGTMTGNLTLAGAPSANLHAATKQYVDTAVTGFVVKTGDVLSGNLRVNQASMKVSGDATSYAFERRQGDSSGYGFRLGASATNPFIATLYDSGGNTISPALNYSTSSSRWNITGDTYLTGALTATGNASVGGTLAVTGNASVGGTLAVTGNATFSAGLTKAQAPVVGSDVVNKTALDAAVAVPYAAIWRPIGAPSGLSGGSGWQTIHWGAGGTVYSQNSQAGLVPNSSGVCTIQTSGIYVVSGNLEQDMATWKIGLLYSTSIGRLYAEVENGGYGSISDVRYLPAGATVQLQIYRSGPVINFSSFSIALIGPATVV